MHQSARWGSVYFCTRRHITREPRCSPSSTAASFFFFFFFFQRVMPPSAGRHQAKVTRPPIALPTAASHIRHGSSTRGQIMLISAGAGASLSSARDTPRTQRHGHAAVYVHSSRKRRRNVSGGPASIRKAGECRSHCLLWLIPCVAFVYFSCLCRAPTFLCCGEFDVTVELYTPARQRQDA